MSLGTELNDISDDLDVEITQAFDNVESALIAAGALGWSQVSYKSPSRLREQPTNSIYSRYAGVQTHLLSCRHD